MMDVELRPHLLLLLLLLALQGGGFHDDLRGRDDSHPAHARRGGGGAALLLLRRRPLRRRDDGRQSLCRGGGGGGGVQSSGPRGRRRGVVKPPAKALLRLDLRRQVGELLRHGVPGEREARSDYRHSSSTTWHGIGGFLGGINVLDGFSEAGTAMYRSAHLLVRSTVLTNEN